MTCIIGVEFEGKVYLAGDKLGSNGWTGAEYVHPKVFENGDGIFGFTSTYRFGQLLEFGLADVIAPKEQKSMHRWMVKDLVPRIRMALVDGGYKIDDGGCTALLGINGELWKLQNDCSILRSINGYAAVGSGDQLALSAMSYVMRHHPPKSAKEVKQILAKVMEVVGHHSTSVGSECYIVSK